MFYCGGTAPLYSKRLAQSGEKGREVNFRCEATRCGDIVLDGFGGSGTTLIAAERTGRVARMVESIHSIAMSSAGAMRR